MPFTLLDGNKGIYTLEEVCTILRSVNVKFKIVKTKYKVVKSQSETKPHKYKKITGLLNNRRTK